MKHIYGPVMFLVCVIIVSFSDWEVLNDMLFVLTIGIAVIVYQLSEIIKETK